MLTHEQKKKLAEDNPARLYKMLLKEQAKAEVKYISEAGQAFLNAIRDRIDDYIEIYQEDYKENWQEAMEADWKGLYREILEGKDDLLLEYFRSIL